MKAVIINGTMRRGSSNNIAHLILNKIPNLEISEFFLPKDMPSFCCGCYSCIYKGEKTCPHIKSMDPIKTALIEADLVVITSPVYVFDVSGQLKALFDHLAYMWMSHRPDKAMFNKVGLSVVTAAGAGMKATAKTIKRNMTWWGMKRYYSYGKAVMATSFENITPKTMKKIEKETTKLAKKLSKTLAKKDKIKATFKTRLLFKIMTMMQKGHPEWNAYDNNHWKESGYLDGHKPWIVSK